MIACPKCNSTKITKNGLGHTGVQQYKCSKCKYNFEEKNVNETVFEQGDDFINIVCASRRMLSKEDIIEKFKINLEQWEIEKFKIKTSEGYRKDRRVKWKVKDGVVLEGDVDDTGKMLVVPLYHLEVRFKLKVVEIKNKSIVDDLIKDAKKFSPKYPKIIYKKHKEKFLLEPDMPDIHYGKLAWSEESGDDWDIKIAEEFVLDNLNSLVNQSSVYNIDRVLLPFGNDFFNVNSKLNTTVNGTPQQEDTRYQKTYVKGRKLAVKMIDLLSTIAPVDVLIVVGNHDEERTFYLGDSLECWYDKNPNVTIDNSAKKRKYYSYGKNLIGFTHGYHEKLNELPLIMSLEQPELWSTSIFREWQTGDKHHKKEIKTSLKEDEQKGVMVRILRSLAGNDAWHFDKGYIGQQRKAEAFIRHFEKGLVAQFTSFQ